MPSLFIRTEVLTIMTCFITQHGLTIEQLKILKEVFNEMSYACFNAPETVTPTDNYVFDEALPPTDDVSHRNLARAFVMHTLNEGSVYPIQSVAHWVTTKTRLNSLQLHQDIRFNASRTLRQHYMDILLQHSHKCHEFIEKEKGQQNV